MNQEVNYQKTRSGGQNGAIQETEKSRLRKKKKEEAILLFKKKKSASLLTRNSNVIIEQNDSKYVENELRKKE